MTAIALAVLGLLLVLLVVVNGVLSSKIGTLSLADSGQTTSAATRTPARVEAATQVRTKAGNTPTVVHTSAPAPTRVALVRLPRSSVPESSTTSGPTSGGTAASTSGPAPGPERPANGEAPPEIGMFDASDQSPQRGSPVSFRWSAGDPDGLIVGAVIDFGDGSFDRQDFEARCDGTVGDPVTEYPPFEHTFQQAGNYTVTIRVFSAGACGSGPLQNAVADTGVAVAVLPDPIKLATADLP